MHPNDSFSYEKPSYTRQSYQNTAAKSPQRKRVDQTGQFTPTRFSKKPSDRVSDFKNSINKCIQELSSKKSNNREALEEVRDVNRQIIQVLNSVKAYRSSERPYENSDRLQYKTDYAPRYDQASEKQRQTIAPSSFNLHPTGDNLLRPSNFQTSQVYRPSSQASNRFQTEDILQKIRNQRAQNESLQRQLYELQNEQRMIQASIQGARNQQENYLLEENLRLREELERVNDQEGIGSIYDEFQRLKEDNERLRKETISFLKGARY